MKPQPLRYLGAVFAVALASLSIGSAVALVHPNINSHDDVLGVQTYCSYRAGNPIVTVEVEVTRSPDRTSNLTFDTKVEYDSGGSHYSGTVYVSLTETPGDALSYFVNLTTAGPKGLLETGGTELTTATNVEISILRHSDTELQAYERSRNLSTACT